MPTPSNNIYFIKLSEEFVQGDRDWGNTLKSLTATSEVYNKGFEIFKYNSHQNYCQARFQDIHKGSRQGKATKTLKMYKKSHQNSQDKTRLRTTKIQSKTSKGHQNPQKITQASKTRCFRTFYCSRTGLDHLYGSIVNDSIQNNASRRF